MIHHATRRLAPTAALLATLLVAAAPVGADSVAADAETEYRVKAAFLFNFARFVEWPTGGDGVMRVCLYGPDPFGETLDRTVEGKHARGMPFEVVRLQRADPADGCQMLFVGDVGAKREAAALDAVAGRPVLTVGDRSPFAAHGGMINFVVDDGRVGFEINRAAAERAGLRISSKLLGLARIVEERRAAGSAR